MSIFFISCKYLLSKKYTKLPSFSVFLAFVGTFLSVATLIIVLSVMNGFKDDFEKLIIGTRPHITVYPENQAFEKLSQKIEEIKKINHNVEANGVVNGQGVLMFSGKTSGVMIKGVTKEYFSRNLLKNSIISGNFVDGQVVIGVEIAKSLGIKIGDNITVLSSKMRKSLFGEIPLHKKYKVSGFFQVNMYLYDSSMVYLDVNSASSLILDDENGVNAIEIILKNPNDMQSIYEKIVQIPLFSRNYVTNWKNDNQSFIDAIATQTAVMSLILSLFLIISSFITFSTLSSVVNEKKRSIAILQSFGYSSVDIIKIFITFGSMIVIPAIIFGGIFGIVVSINIENIKNFLENLTGSTIFDSAYYFLSYIPSKVHWISVIKVCFLSLILGLFSVILPAVRSKKILPHESLRFE